jgi:hypothetical protein
MSAINSPVIENLRIAVLRFTRIDYVRSRRQIGRCELCKMLSGNLPSLLDHLSNVSVEQTPSVLRCQNFNIRRHALKV